MFYLQGLGLLFLSERASIKANWQRNSQMESEAEFQRYIPYFPTIAQTQSPFCTWHFSETMFHTPIAAGRLPAGN